VTFTWAIVIIQITIAVCGYALWTYVDRRMDDDDLAQRIMSWTCRLTWGCAILNVIVVLGRIITS
jgi:hypothetical protein